MLLMMTFLGMHSVFKMRPLALAFHGMGMAALCTIFTLYVCLLALFGGGSQWWLYIVVFCFTAIDFVVAKLSVDLLKLLIKVEKDLDEGANPVTDSERARDLEAALAPRAAQAIVQAAERASGQGKKKADSVRTQLNKERRAFIDSLDCSDAPSQFFCPILLTIMSDPVIAEDGHSYDRDNIEQW
jgi:hypothetical protein